MPNWEYRRRWLQVRCRSAVAVGSGLNDSLAKSVKDRLFGFRVVR
jgi:hypothetical protein